MSLVWLPVDDTGVLPVLVAVCCGIPVDIVLGFVDDWSEFERRFYQKTVSFIASRSKTDMTHCDVPISVATNT